MAQTKKRGNRIKPEVRDKVIQLYMQGYSGDQIIAMTGIHPTSLGGTISSAKLRGAIPSDFVPPPAPGSPPPGPRAASAPSAPSSAPPSGAGSSNIATTSPVPPATGGTAHRWQQSPTLDYAMGTHASVYYQVERLEPSEGDLAGLVGRFSHDITDEEVGNQFGRGFYRIGKFEPGQPVVFRHARLSGAYGTPRNPRKDVGHQTFSQRMLGNRIAMARGIDEGELPPRRLPLERRYPDRLRPDDDEHPLAEFARHGAQAGESIAVAAVQQLGKLHEMTIKKQDEERKAGPQTFLTSFIDKERERDRSQRDEERRREEKRLNDERQRAEEQRREEERRWERRQEELDKAHKREMERIQKEAESRERMEQQRQRDLLDLYDKRMELHEKAAQTRENLLKEDRDKLMAELKEISRQSAEEIAAAKDELREAMEKDREILKQQHDLKMQALSNEHSLRQDILKIREENLKDRGGDTVEKLVGKLADGIEKTIKEVVDLKKIQAVSGLSPEAQAAHVDATARPAGAASPQQQQRAIPLGEIKAEPRVRIPEESAESSNGNGNSPGKKQEAMNMESQVVANMNEPFFQDVLKEWALHVESGNDATAFANMFMEWMRDDSSAEASSSRKACGAFTTFISVRTWEQVVKVISPALSPEQIKIFQTPPATEFYEQFRTMVVESVRDYWKSYLAAKMAEKEAARAAAAGSPAEAPTA